MCAVSSASKGVLACLPEAYCLEPQPLAAPAGQVDGFSHYSRWRQAFPGSCARAYPSSLRPGPVWAHVAAPSQTWKVRWPEKLSFMFSPYLKVTAEVTRSFSA